MKIKDFGNNQKKEQKESGYEREEDYDGYNDYYVNPEYHRSERTRKRVEQQKEDEYESK